MSENIPKGWKWVKVGEIVFINSKNLTPNYPYDEIYYLDTGSVAEGRLISSYKKFYLNEAPSRAKRIVNDGDIVYSLVRPIQRHYGIIKNPPDNLIVSTGFAVITADNNKAENRFIYYYLTLDEIVDYLDSIAESSTTTYPSIVPDDLKNLIIPLPPLPEQKAIAEVLSSIDDKIDLLHRQNKTLEKMAMTLFRQWFIEPTKDGLPEGWEEVKIGDVLDVVLGGTPSTRVAEYWNGDIPWINSGEINNFRIIKATKYITESGLRNSNTKLMPKGTTVLAITGATLGKVSLLEIDTCANQSVVGIVPNDIFPKEYIYLWIKYKIDEIILNETGGAQPHINQNDVRNTVIIKPIKEYLNERNKKLKNIFSKITNNVFQIQTLEKLRDTLLPKLMSGEVRVMKKK